MAPWKGGIHRGWLPQGLDSATDGCCTGGVGMVALGGGVPGHHDKEWCVTTS